MLSAIVVVALASFPQTACEHCALIAERPPPVRVVAQVVAETPPSEPPSAPEQPENAPDAHELQRRIDALNVDIRAVDVSWPPQYLILGYAGYVIAPISLIGGATSLGFGLLSTAVMPGSGPATMLIAVGVGGLVIAAIAVGVIVFSVVRGSSIQAERKEYRDGLIKQRDELEHELRRRQAGRTRSMMWDLPEPVQGPLITVLHF